MENYTFRSSSSSYHQYNEDNNFKPFDTRGIFDRASQIQM